MSEKFSTNTATGVASGTNKTIINLYDAIATPTKRAMVYDLVLGSVATPADQAAKIYLARTTANNTAGSSFTPVNLDPAGPAGELSSGIGTYSAEPTYTANKQMLVISINQRATFRWVASPGSEILLAATQNNGVGLKSSSSTSTQAIEATILFRE